jgi:hypothetical protein
MFDDIPVPLIFGIFMGAFGITQLTVTARTWLTTIVESKLTMLAWNCEQRRAPQSLSQHL